MKNKLFLIVGCGLIMSSALTSCTSVDPGHEGVIISWGGETDMTKTLPEGLHWGHVTDDIIEYEIREQTMEIGLTLFDKNDMQVPVTVTVYFNPQKEKTNYLHKEIGPNFIEVKLKPLVEGALAKVVPQYSAQDLNKNKREEAETKLKAILSKESAGLYVDIPRVQFKKVGIPDQVAKLAEETAVQLGRNELAAKKEEEQVQLAKARVAEAQGRYDAGVLDAKRRDLLSAPKMLELQKLENEKIMWEGYARTGKSPFGENNIFGTNQSPALLLQR